MRAHDIRNRGLVGNVSAKWIATHRATTEIGTHHKNSTVIVRAVSSVVGVFASSFRHLREGPMRESIFGLRMSRCDAPGTPGTKDCVIEPELLVPVVGAGMDPPLGGGIILSIVPIILSIMGNTI